jgi:hypothetical protein
MYRHIWDTQRDGGAFSVGTWPAEGKLPDGRNSADRSQSPSRDSHDR